MKGAYRRSTTNKSTTESTIPKIATLGNHRLHLARKCGGSSEGDNPGRGQCRDRLCRDGWQKDRPGVGPNRSQTAGGSMGMIQNATQAVRKGGTGNLVGEYGMHYNAFPR